jgi:esterase/lipase superfamily enzyme
MPVSVVSLLRLSERSGRHGKEPARPHTPASRPATLSPAGWSQNGPILFGAYSNDAELTALGAVVIDMTNVKADDPSNHAKFAQLAEIAPEMRRVLERRCRDAGEIRDRANNIRFRN